MGEAGRRGAGVLAEEMGEGGGAETHGSVFEKGAAGEVVEGHLKFEI